MKKSLLTLCLSIALMGTSASAAVRLAGVFGDHMVLQRDMKVPVWGWAEPGEEVTVTFAGQSKTTKAGEDGKWMLHLDKLKASAEGSELKAGEDVCKDVLVGEVWLCSGQSNMEWSLKATHTGAEDIKAANHPSIRLMTTPRKALRAPLKDDDYSWKVCEPASATTFSAVGYHFGTKLHAELGVPIGLINSSWGGTKIEPWTPPEGFAQVEELKEISEALAADQPGSEAQKKKARESIDKVKEWVTDAETALEGGKHLPALPQLAGQGRGSHQNATRIYNGKIHALVPFAIRGAIWYQGESNRTDGELYFHKKRALVEGWRKIWGYDLSFYWVQLAAWKEPNENPEGGDGWAALWNAQRRALSIPGTGMASAVDLLDRDKPGDIHPRNKKDVGHRLALWALAKDYGQKDLVHSGPLFKSHKADGDKIILSFDSVGSGLMVGEKIKLDPTVEIKDGELKHFAIAGEDKKWHWAKAEIKGDTVVVSCPEVPAPIAVRYAFSMNPEGANLYNREGLPASPFRTDDWPVTAQ